MADSIAAIQSCLIRALGCAGVALSAALAVLAARRAWAAFGTRAATAWRSLAPRARAALLLALAAFTIYGGGKGGGGGDGGNGGDGDGGDRGAGGPPLMSGMTSGAFAISNLCFTSIDIATNGIVSLTAAWPGGSLGDTATLDFFAKTNLIDAIWQWMGAECVGAPASNATFSVALATLGDATNAPSSAFFTFRHRESDCQTMRDFDLDGIPDIYELFNGTNPYQADAALVPRLTVGAGGAYANIQDALAASTNYSIVSLAPETFHAHQPIALPAHPVMLVGEDGHATINSDAGTCAFVIDKGNDEQTLLRGFAIVLAARSSYQAAFWCGGNIPWGGLAATPTFEDIRIRAPYPEPLYYGWHFYRQSDASASIRNCTVNAAGASAMHGIYSYDGPKLTIENCTFVNFPPDHAGVFVQATSGYHGGSSNAPAASIAGCAFDDSFTNAVPLARLGSATNAANCFVAMSDCLVPAALYPEYEPDFAGNVCVTNGGLSWNGLALPGSAAFDFGIGDIRDTLFSHTSDSDGDGLSDYDEAYFHETDPWLADSDGDELTDGAEIDYGTDPQDFYSCFRRITAVSCKPSYASAITNYLGWGASTNAWQTNTWTAITENLSTNVFEFATTDETLFFTEFSDIDGDGLYSPEGDLVVSRTVAPLKNAQTLTFDFTANLDADRDGLPDLWERIHAGAGLSPTNAADTMLDFDGDALPNLHEYLMGYDPEVPDGSNTVFSVASRSIDERIAGKNPTNALPVFLNYPACGTNLVRNTDCWAYGIDLSCASLWNSFSSGGNRKTGTLISPRHIIYANHYHSNDDYGKSIYFLGTNDVIYSAKLVASSRVGTTDIQIGLLDTEIPPLVTPAKILPPDYANYLPIASKCPILSFDQEERALVQELSSLSSSVTIEPSLSSFHRRAFHENIVRFDSSNPSFLILGDSPILLFTFFSATVGPSVAFWKDEIQSVMDQLMSGYYLNEADFSEYDSISGDLGYDE